MRLRWLRSGHLFMIGALGLAGCSGPAAPTPAISTVPAGQPAASDPPSVACTFAIPEEHLSRDVGPAGGAFTVPITTQPSCTWTVTTAAPFVVVDPSSGTGSGGVLVTVASNSGDSRVTPLTVAGEVVTIRQGAASAPSPGCTLAVTPGELAVPASGGTVSVAVGGAGKSCEWTATTPDAFLEIVSASPQVGDGTVNIRIAANTGRVRTGSLTVAGRLVTVTQEASTACVAALSVSPDRVRSCWRYGETGCHRASRVRLAGADGWLVSDLRRFD